MDFMLTLYLLHMWLSWATMSLLTRGQRYHSRRNWSRPFRQEKAEPM